jgi:hypothetical protein
MDFDWAGREGVHKMTQEFYTPKDIFSYAWTPALQGVFNIGVGYNLNNAFDEAFVYDPVNHAAPLGMAGFTIPTLSSPGGLSITGFQDHWNFTIHRDSIQGTSSVQSPACIGFSDGLGHIFPGPPATERRFESRRGGIFLRSRFPAAASLPNRFGLGIATALTPRGSFSSMGYSNNRGAVCWPGEHTDVHKFTQTLQTLGAGWLGVSGLGGFTSIPAGTWDGTTWIIMDTQVNFQGHVDWLESQGLI